MHRFRGAPWTYEWLELTAAKVARSVLRGRGAGNGFLLPCAQHGRDLEGESPSVS